MEGGSRVGEEAMWAWIETVRDAAAYEVAAGAELFVSDSRRPVAVALRAVYVLPRPAGRHAEGFAAVKPDLHKLTRATVDGLRPLLPEDSRIAHEDTWKVWAVDGWTGALIELRAVEDGPDLSPWNGLR
jgi:hypothetical protein